MNTRRAIIWLLATISICSAQAATAQTAGLSFTAPTHYVDGTRLPAGAIVGYDAECSSWTPEGGAAGPCTQFAPVSVSGAQTAITMNGTVPATGGRAGFRVRARTSNAASAWTEEVFKLFPAVTTPPNPPGNVTVAVVVELNMAPVFKLTSTGKRSAEAAGFIPTGLPCSGNVLFYYREKPYRRVNADQVRWWNVVPGASVAAPCGPAT